MRINARFCLRFGRKAATSVLPPRIENEKPTFSAVTDQIEMRFVWYFGQSLGIDIWKNFKIFVRLRVLIRPYSVLSTDFRFWSMQLRYGFRYHRTFSMLSSFW
jgi:hypothetical protein